LKICFTTNSSPWSKFSGGAQIFIHNLAQSLTELGHKITVIYTGSRNRLSHGEKELKYRAIFAPYIGYPFTGKFRQLNSLTVAKKISEYLKTNEIDIVNSVGSESYFAPIICKRKHIPFIISLEHPNLSAISPSLSLLNPLKASLDILRSRELLIARHSCRHADQVVTPSMFTKLQTNRFFKVPYNKIRIINHGLTARMLENSFLNGDRKPSDPLIYFGRLESQKGVDILIKAYHRLIHEEHLKSQKLLIIGDGPDKDKYYNLVRRLKLQSKVSFKGWRDQNYILEKLSTASLCVLPSRSESFGLSIAEALSQGVPLITTMSGSIPEVTNFGKGAWISIGDDINSLCFTISQALKNYPESLKRAKQGMFYVQKKFTWRNAAVQYENLYSELIDKFYEISGTARTFNLLK
jgi:glycosyltransferase involved in cell wall biosynthesis